MPDVITLSCPNCGGKLEITEDIDRFSCGHCGVEHIVRRSGGIVAIKPFLENITQEVRKAAKGAENTASEMALKRLDQEISVLQGNLKEVQNRIRKIEDQKNIRKAGMVIGGFGILFIVLGFVLPIFFDNISSGVTGGGFLFLFVGFVMRYGFTSDVKPWKDKEIRLSEKLVILLNQRQYHYDQVNKSEKQGI